MAAQAACVLEADAPKIGNVTRYSDFEDTTLEDFHLSGILIGPLLNDTLEVGVGQTILRGARLTHSRVGRNTNLGILMLLCPLAASWLRLLEMQHINFSPREGFLKHWREENHLALQALSKDDATAVYEAIRLLSPGGLGEVSSYDVREVDQPSITLLEAMCISAERDMIGDEYRTNFAMVFELALPKLEQNLTSGLSMPKAIAQTHLELIAMRGDSLIKRKNGDDIYEDIRARARNVRDLGGLLTPAGTTAFYKLDEYMRRDGNSLNPGSTADILAAAIFVHILANEYNHSS